ncbi:hypothetical protein pb186bvf_011283 [Paramecium bursaria]
MFLFLESKPLKTIDIRTFQAPGVQLYPQDAENLKNFGNLRAAIEEGNYSLIPQYLAIHTQLRITVKTILGAHPLFSFKAIVSQTDIGTNHLSIDQALEADYLMMVYTYCIHQLNSSIPLIAKIRQAQIDDQKMPQAQCLEIFKNFKAGILLLRETRQNAHLLANLASNTKTGFPELTPPFFNNFITYYSIQANLVYLELQTDMDKRQGVYHYLVKAIQTLDPYGNQRLIDYKIVALIYFRAQGFRQVSERINLQIEKENYRNKSFSILVQELLLLCQEMCDLVNIVQGLALDEDFLEAAKIILSKNIPFAQKQFQLYQKVVRNPIGLPNSNTILFEYDPVNVFDII